MAEEWKDLLKRSIDSAQDLRDLSESIPQDIDQVIRQYPVRINPYYRSLIRQEGDAIWKMSVPQMIEIQDDSGMEDPLSEEDHSPVCGLTHRYPDRVLFYVTSVCAMYCRFCTRKRKVGRGPVQRKQLDAGLAYIRSHPEIRDVIVSGGDPLTLTDQALDYVLSSLRAIPHVEIIRIGSRVPVVLPQRVTPALCSVLKMAHPLFLNTHFNHPAEITPESRQACQMLADAGIPLGNQAVLLRGVNDDPEVLKDLFKKLLTMRVRPYYLYQADIVNGANHFRTTVEKGLEVIGALRGHVSGLAVPQFVIDAPGGGGKIPLLPEYVVKRDERELVLRNYAGLEYRYPNVNTSHPLGVHPPMPQPPAVPAHFEPEAGPRTDEDVSSVVGLDEAMIARLIEEARASIFIDQG
ncbi:MAG: KamA family radical SAM protein [Candidatus Riflebacteria bacterium]|nr:KamA family radical SAM protein [Candidatus Riflebacteria bacterium]